MLSDLAEKISTNEVLEAGDVVIIDPAIDESVVLSSIPYDTSVAGIVSTKPGILLGDDVFSQENEIALAEMKQADMGGNIAQVQAMQANSIAQKYSGNVPLALAGRVPCKVTDENGPIARGDLLTTSSTPGYAMRADIDDFSKIGSVIGKAMESLNSGTGVIIVLVGKN